MHLASDILRLDLFGDHQYTVVFKLSILLYSSLKIGHDLDLDLDLELELELELEPQFHRESSFDSSLPLPTYLD
eukprot:COSAG05_NODE_1602_length_4434_cov_2.280277_1_plen_74_part_00